MLRREIMRNTGAAFGGRPIGGVFQIILYHKYLWIFLIYSLYIPYIFPSYVPYIFPCVFLNVWSQQKTNPYRKTTFILFSRLYAFYILDIYGCSLNIPHIFHLYFLDMFHMCSLVYFLIYGVKSRSGHDRSQNYSSHSVA